MEKNEFDRLYERLVLQNQVKPLKKRIKKKITKQEQTPQNDQKTVTSQVHFDQSKTLSTSNDTNPHQTCLKQEKPATGVVQNHERSSQVENVPDSIPVPQNSNTITEKDDKYLLQIDVFRLNYRHIARRMKVSVSKFTKMLLNYLQNRTCDRDFEIFINRRREQTHRKNRLQVTVRRRFVSKQKLKTIISRLKHPLVEKSDSCRDDECCIVKDFVFFSCPLSSSDRNSLNIVPLAPCKFIY